MNYGGGPRSYSAGLPSKSKLSLTNCGCHRRCSGVPVRSGRVVWMLLCGISQVRRLASQCRNSSDGATELASSRIAPLYIESTGRTWQAVWQKKRVPASGETLPTDQLISDYIQPRLVDILQPEIEFAGLTGGRRLSYLCWLNHLRLIPHNWGTAIRTAAILHWMSTVPPVTEAIAAPTALFELDCTENPIRDAVVREPFRIDPTDGCIAVPTGPGLGIEVVREAVEEYRIEMVRIG